MKTPLRLLATALLSVAVPCLSAQTTPKIGTNITPPTLGQAAGLPQASDGAGGLAKATPQNLQQGQSDPLQNTEVLFGQSTTGKDVCTVPAAGQGAICWYAGQITYWNFATSQWTPFLNSSGGGSVYVLTDGGDGTMYQVETAQGNVSLIPYTGSATPSTSLTFADASSGNYTLTSYYGVPVIASTTTAGVSGIYVADVISGTSTLTTYSGNSTSTH